MKNLEQTCRFHTELILCAVSNSADPLNHWAVFECDRFKVFLGDGQDVRAKTGSGRYRSGLGGGLQGPTGVSESHLCQNGSFSSPPLTAALGENSRWSRSLRYREKKI